MSLYETYEKIFEWQQFPEGRVQFSGGIRGWDERGHDTFAVDIDAQVIYGEIDSVFLPNQHDFNVQVVSFGYGMRENVGIVNDGGPGRHAQGRFSRAYLEHVQSLVVQLVRSALHFEERPSILTEFPNSYFQGKLIFPKGWAVGAGSREVTI